MSGFPVIPSQCEQRRGNPFFLVGADDPVRPNSAKRCHSEPVTDVTGSGIRLTSAALPRWDVEPQGHLFGGGVRAPRPTKRGRRKGRTGSSAPTMGRRGRRPLHRGVGDVSYGAVYRACLWAPRKNFSSQTADFAPLRGVFRRFPRKEGIVHNLILDVERISGYYTLCL